VSWREKKLARREEAVSQREALATELWAKLSALDKILEEQRIQQTMAMERLEKLQQELEGKASDAALAEEKLKAKEQSLGRRETDLSRRETDLTFREEMLTQRGEMLAEHELEAEKKENVGVLGPTAHPGLPFKVLFGVGQCYRL
jgi:DNA repair exonuclease SbcCD ATPase subunit